MYFNATNQNKSQKLELDDSVLFAERANELILCGKPK